jgi:hypothetical protein
MYNTTNWLLDAMRDLARIAEEGQLSDLQHAFAADCREVGGLPSPDERARQVRQMNAHAIAIAREVGRVAAQFFGLPFAQCEQAACEVLVRDPWTDVALECIGDFRGATSEKALPTVAGTIGGDSTPCINAKLERERARRRSG